MNRFNRWLLLGLALILGCLLGMLGFSLWDKIPTPVERVTWSPEVQWIAPSEPSYRFYTRRTFDLPDAVQAGWLRLSADNDFILYVNGHRIARENSSVNSSLGLASKLNVPFQDFNDQTNYRVRTGLNYLLASTRDWKLTVYIDLTSYLRPGKNVVALEIQKGQTSPRVVVEGAVYPVANSSPVNLTTGATLWRVSTLSQTHQGLRWFDPDFPDQSWAEAKALGSVQEATYSRLSQHLFDRPLQGTWISGTESPQGEAWLRGSWQIPQKRQRAFIRFAGQGEYALLINGLLVNRYSTDDGSQLHMYEVTNFLQTGVNTLAVRLARPLEREGSSGQNSSLGFFLDGWVETNQGDIVGTITTDSTWSALTQPITGWTKGSGGGQPVNLLSLPNPQAFQRTFEGNAYLLNYPDYLLHQSLWQLGGISCALLYAWGLGWLWLRRRESWWDSLGAGTALLLPGTLFLISIGLLKHRYAEAERGLLFAQSQSNVLILLGFVGIILLTLLGSQMSHKLGTWPHWGLWFLLGLVACISLGLIAGGSVLFIALILVGIVALTLLWRQGHWQLQDSYNVLQQAWTSWGQWLVLVLIVGFGFSLRAYNLDFIDLDSDENTSLDATRGILRTGAPLATSGIWYTRGPVYHYLLALWLRIVGDSAVNARFLSVLFGTATLILIFIFTRKVTGKVWIALVVTAFLAIDPWEIWYSRNIRFYQVLQFLTLLTFWSFIQGFIEQKARYFQYIFFVALTLSILTQEVTVTILPCFVIGFIFFYRSFRLSIDWSILVSSLTALVISMYDLIFAAARSLTPLAALSESTGGYLKPHLSDITEVCANFFIGPDRIHTIYSLFFLLGFIYFSIAKCHRLLFLFSSIVVNLLFVTILSYQTAERYAYSIYPIFIALAIYSAIYIIGSLGKRLQLVLNGLLPLQMISWCCIALLLFSNIELGRVTSGNQEAINRRNTQLFEYIRTHRKTGDLVISSTPSFAAISLGKLDYSLLGSSYFDAIYWREGRLIDRWSGGVIVSNPDQMNRILENSQRVWIHVDDAREGRLDPEFIEFIQTLGKPVLDTFGCRLRLWQPEDGLLPRIPNQGKDLGAY